jgi:8-oxo-dGTP diphosphatase
VPDGVVGVIEVVAAVIERDGKILITRRPEGSHLAGLWEFPGGKRRPGETPEEALRREIIEELGAAVSVGASIDMVEWEYPGRRMRLSFYRCSLTGEPRALQGQELAWALPEELRRYDFPPADAVLIARLSRG